MMIDEGSFSSTHQRHCGVAISYITHLMQTWTSSVLVSSFDAMFLVDNNHLRNYFAFPNTQFYLST